MEINPFSDSKNLAFWATENLTDRGIDDVADWRMLEYWFQVEIFRLTKLNKAGRWHHVGDYEHPYHTDLPRSGSKTNTKWIDLVLAEPDPSRPDSVVWMELKDIGRNKNTIVNNAKGLGHDLAALWALNPSKTKDLWLNPQPHSIDRGRLGEWNKFGPHIDCATQLIAQIVIGPIAQDPDLSPRSIINIWLNSFVKKTSSNTSLPEISFEKTGKLFVYGLVTELPR